jgi:ABC-2 type transport system ATP-binding protein
MLEVFDLTKSFYNTLAIDGINFKVKVGEIFGLLGPNGAGKTTTLRILMKILTPDSGEIRYKNKPHSKVKRHVFGYFPEERGLYQKVRVVDMLVYFGRLNNLSRHKAEVEAIRFLDRFGLIDYTQRKVCELSKGLQQKIQFIVASMHNPEILILDEPFIGLDPVNQIALRKIIQKSKDIGKIIILSTHQMEEVERLCDHICLLNNGRVILDGSIESIKKRFKEDAYYIESDNDLSFIKDIESVEILEEHNQSCKISIHPPEVVQKVIQAIFRKTMVKKFIQVEPSLQKIFISLIKEDVLSKTKDSK